MAGHSKWNNIKRKKSKVDAQRAKIFTKAIKEIQIAARMGGGDPAGNPRLRTAILSARSVNMPTDNIERAIKKGTGDLEGVNYEEIVFEGYGPGGTAVYVETLSDNRNRTVGEVRHLFSKYGGNMGESGCVSWMFDRKGIIALDPAKADEEKVMEAALELGVEDISVEEEVIEVYTEWTIVEDVREGLEKAGIEVESAEVSMVPQNTVSLDAKQAETFVKLIDALEDNEDVQNVYANADIPDEVMANL
ncbi:MAG: YebC/PmpR family DNA-binding transcriptional regulator [Candidatus Omnitrophica bacterium]|nr:YebC/PmpR family DNA-binding transcriptional regulator [Candidatus Omnitrophota bacterium]MCA9426228.1 YebC/PmpR family DNA-binding transcriptional regulator [Candidatus Omnitrophota bacterium]MCA9436609.1 YebC/PmpR family DNA-binding transcriptional regulator [Candidatus Omnitrophota bacterium]MCA9440967.1 YebC/PmpR family DNA-binding transcriptional regulator [Candidatus Omnitrophota bacterium]MCB9782165.1 YebC/PmpR family DNA-binding transcriptional regulator [Candidatus Omnitrophota bact